MSLLPISRRHPNPGLYHLLPKLSHLQAILQFGLSKMQAWGIFLAVQWLRLCASTAWGAGSIPGWGTKIPRAEQCMFLVLFQKKHKEQIKHSTTCTFSKTEKTLKFQIMFKCEGERSSQTRRTGSESHKGKKNGGFS